MTSNSSKTAFLPSLRSNYRVFIVLGLLLWGGVKLGQHIFSNSRSSIASTALSDRLSSGNQTFFAEDGTQDKHLAISAYASGNYLAAREHLDRSLLQKPNDPESIIYLNNAIAQQRNPISLAVSIPAKTDPNGAREVLRGVAQAQTEVNNLNGINGRGLSITITSDDNDPSIAKQVAKTLVDRSDILGVIGHSSSGTTLATVDIYKTGQLVSISPISSAVSLSNKSPYFFRTIPSDTHHGPQPQYPHGPKTQPSKSRHLLHRH